MRPQTEQIDFQKPVRVRPAPGCPGILVAHLSAAPKPYVYVGRAMKGISASPLGNPYTGNGAIERFYEWLRDAYKADRAGRATLAQSEAARELRRLAEQYRETGHLTLACWCAPDPCHSDVIASAVIGMVQAEPVTVEIPGLGGCCARWQPTDDGLPWEVTRDGRVVRFSATLAYAREPLARRVASLGPGASTQLELLGMGKCDSCGQVKPGIGHKELCVECVSAALPGAV